MTAPDADARAQAVAAHGSVLVQAPAGSGKTTLLTQRYLRLLAAVEAPEDILALTFTRRAAEEMRERVIGALQGASSPQCPPDLNAQTWALARAARRRLGELDIDVERHPSRLRIETIDSFNAWLAAQLPITSGAGGRLSLADNPRPLYEEAARRALAHEDSFREAVERVLAVGDQRWRELVDLVAEMLPARDRWLRLLVGQLQASNSLDERQLARVRRHFDEDLALLVTRALQNAHDALGGETIQHLSLLLHAAARRAAGERAELIPWAGGPAPLRPQPFDLARWRAIAGIFLTKNGKLRKRFTKTDGFPPGCPELPPMSNLLSEFERSTAVAPALRTIRALPDTAYSEDDWARVRDVAEVLVLAAAELDQVFRERGMVDFPAVAMAALRALGTADAPTDLALRLDYRLKHLLLDEFQDTSSAQLDLVGLLTAGWQRDDGRSVFCVGDPMQSIYGFRQAEVRAFLELAERGIGEVRFDVQRLTANFRSGRNLVEWVNRCFEQVMPREDDRERGAIAFRPSVAVLPASAGPGAVLRAFRARVDEAHAVADLIEARRRDHPQWRIAVLVRARTHAREIAHGLRTRDIAFRAVEIEPLQDRAPVRDLVMLICALLHLADRTAWLALLRAPWAGLSLADLLIIARASPVVWDALCDDGVLERLSDDGRSRCRRLRMVLEAAFRVQSHTATARWVERTWLGLGGPACAADARDLENVRTVFLRLRKLEQQGLPDAADMVRRFADLYADGGPGGAVEIMTIHKAKGLEFDMVIVPALDRASRASRGQLLLMHPFSRTGRDGMVMAARPAIGTDKNRLFEFLRRQSRDAASLEAERLLYVACTRAKSELHLTATVEVADEPDETLDEDAEEAAISTGAPWKPAPGSLLAVLWPAEHADFRAAIATAEPGATPQAVEGLRGGPLRRFPREWTPQEATSGARDAAVPPAAVPREETPIFDWAGETARRVGSLVHAELQVMDLALSNEAVIRARGEHFRRWLTLNGVPAERLDDACERVISALIGVHRDPRGRWILHKGYRDDYREHALSGHAGGEMLRVVFDRSFIDESGIRWVIDYKTSEHRGGSLAEFLEREVERYRPQLERYAAIARKLGPQPVRVGLYFPLMGEWREWAPQS